MRYNSRRNIKMEELNKVEGQENPTVEGTEAAPAAPAKLKVLMDENSIKTFVPLAKVVGIAPQKLYSKKSKKTNDYSYDAIERLLVKESGKSIEQIIAEAAGLASERNAKKAEKAKKEEKKAERKEMKEKVFEAGQRVSYSTYRVIEDVKEKYEVTGTIKTITESGLVIMVKDSDGAECEFTKDTAARKLKIMEVDAEVAGDQAE